MKYHITITDNETGEIELDLDAEAIFASVQSGDDTYKIGKSNCDSRHFSAVLAGLLGVEDDIKADHSKIYKLTKKLYKKT